MSKELPPISAVELHQSIERGDPVVLLDVRYTPGKSDGFDRYLSAHLPGAIYVDLPTQLSNPNISGKGNSPLPVASDFQKHARHWGLHENSRVVVYDDTNGAPAARAWWVLRWAGLKHVQILDGGLNAWKSRGLPVVTEVVSPLSSGTLQVQEGRLPSLGVDEILDFSRSGVLLDARLASAYSDPLNPASGHIPGAKSLPASMVLDAQGSLKPANEIRALAKSLGVEKGVPVAAYCGGGVSAALLVYAFAQAGLSAQLYPGSWSEWITDNSRPIER